ncbi:hypothetical protein GLOIN_2v1764810 [Rhizophagus irregularis DAOM 181602=DAOM 197198]|nr:hypothetical protein GLOIN_2v1764810 [Rhizophagus irregularis DAOM 181602=DAOM 197198]
MTLYAPQEIQNTNIEYNSSDEDLVSHISKWRCIESISEFDRYLNADQAQALAADIITYDRASLAPETVRAVMCLKHCYLDGEELDTQENFG